MIIVKYIHSFEIIECLVVRIIIKGESNAAPTTDAQMENDLWDISSRWKVKACLELRKRKEKIKAIKGFQPLGEESFETGAKSVGREQGELERCFWKSWMLSRSAI